MEPGLSFLHAHELISRDKRQLLSSAPFASLSKGGHAAPNRENISEGDCTSEQAYTRRPRVQHADGDGAESQTRRCNGVLRPVVLRSLDKNVFGTLTGCFLAADGKPGFGENATAQSTARYESRERTGDSCPLTRPPATDLPRFSGSTSIVSPKPPPTHDDAADLDPSPQKH